MHVDRLGALLDCIAPESVLRGDQLVEPRLSSPTANTIDPGSRRMILLAPIIAALPVSFWAPGARASKLDHSQTVVTLPSAIKWTEWNGLPPQVGEMATLYGGLDKVGPDGIFMKGYPRYRRVPPEYK